MGVDPHFMYSSFTRHLIFFSSSLFRVIFPVTFTALGVAEEYRALILTPPTYCTKRPGFIFLNYIAKVPLKWEPEHTMATFFSTQVGRSHNDKIKREQIIYLPFTTSHAMKVVLLGTKSRKKSITDIASCPRSKIPWWKTGQCLSRNHPWHSFSFQLLLAQIRGNLLKINLKKWYRIHQYSARTMWKWQLR